MGQEHAEYRGCIQAVRDLETFDTLLYVNTLAPHIKGTFI